MIITLPLSSWKRLAAAASVSIFLLGCCHQPSTAFVPPNSAGVHRRPAFAPHTNTNHVLTRRHRWMHPLETFQGFQQPYNITSIGIGEEDDYDAMEYEAAESNTGKSSE
jgi:hypothetical protein